MDYPDLAWTGVRLPAVVGLRTWQYRGGFSPFEPATLGRVSLIPLNRTVQKRW